MSASLLLVDGMNIVMRCAFGGSVPVEQAVPIAAGMIRRAIRDTQSLFMVVAFDSPAPSWRALERPNYKANRTKPTAPWLGVEPDRRWIPAVLARLAESA